MCSWGWRPYYVRAFSMPSPSRPTWNTNQTLLLSFPKSDGKHLAPYTFNVSIGRLWNIINLSMLREVSGKSGAWPIALSRGICLSWPNLPRKSVCNLSNAVKFWIIRSWLLSVWRFEHWEHFSHFHFHQYKEVETSRMWLGSWRAVLYAAFLPYLWAYPNRDEIQVMPLCRDQCSLTFYHGNLVTVMDGGSPGVCIANIPL